MNDMKKIMMWCWVALAAVAAAACSPDEVDDLNGGAIPLAGELKIEVDVDQTTNYVTFRLLNEGMVPMWIFSETETVTQNPYQRRYRRAGDYTVEVKAFNRNGISDGAATCTFTVENDYSATHPLYGEGSKSWVIDASADGHFGCGPLANPLEWYQAKANEKSGTGLYDNVLTFNADGTYKFETGGTVFVNAGVTLLGENPTPGTDFSVAWEDHTGKYEYKSADKVIVFPQQQPAYTVVGYVPNDEYLTGSKLELRVLSLEDNAMELVWYTATGNGGGEIAWYMRYVPKDGSAPVEKDPLYGAGSKTWRIAAGEPGHMGCGPTAESPAEWWSAAPNDKQAFGVYDDRITFTEDGKFIYDPGEDGLTYVNVGTSFNPDPDTVKEDFDIENVRQETTYAIDDEYTRLTLPAKTFMPYVPNDEMFNNPTFIVRELTTNRMVLVAATEGIAWQMIFVPEDYSDEPDEPAFNPGAMLEAGEYRDGLAGSWTWENTSFGHFGCGGSIGNPVDWWQGAADCKAGCSMYDDVMTFGADGSYTFDPVDGMTYMNKDVKGYAGEVVDSPLGDDFRVKAEKQTSTYTYAAATDGGYPAFTLPEGVLFSYIANNVQLTTDRTYYITAMWENQVEITWFTATGNGGTQIGWRYRLKRVQ